MYIMLLFIVGYHGLPSAKNNLQVLFYIKIHSHCLSHAASFWRYVLNVITAYVWSIIIIINVHSQTPVRPSSIIQLTCLAGYDVVERDTLRILHTSEQAFGYCTPVEDWITWLFSCAPGTSQRVISLVLAVESFSM